MQPDRDIATAGSPALGTEPHDAHARTRSGAVADYPRLVWSAALSALRKLDPRLMVRNPVMFVVEVGAAFTTVSWLASVAGNAPEAGFEGALTVWLWFTVFFANFAEAMAEGRGKAQAATLRSMRKDTIAHVLDADGSVRQVGAASLRRGDTVVVSAGELIPGDGEVIEGIASVDESAITGESAPVIRESGGDRSSVTGGTKVLSDQLVIRIMSDPGETFLDKMIALVEGAERQKTPNEIALTILLAALTIIFLGVTVALMPVRGVRGAARLGPRADRTARVPHSHDHRRAALGDRHRRDGPARAPQRARDVGPGGRGGRRRRHAAARQDRHDHVRQPPGRRLPAR